MNTALLVLNGSLIAGIYAFAKAGTASALGVLAWQLLFAAAVIGAIAAWRGDWPPIDRHTLRYAAIAGVLGVSAPSLVTFCALSRVPAGFIGVIGALSPLFTYAMAVAVGMERVQRWRVAGLALGLVGVLALLLPRGALPAADALPWALAAIAGPLLLAAGNVFRTLAWPRGLAPLSAASLMLALQALVVVPVALVTGAFVLPLPAQDPGDLALIGAGALTAIFYLGAFELQRRAGPVAVGQLGYVITVASLLIGAFAFGERIGAGMLPAVALVFAGVALVNRGGWRGAPAKEHTT
jgi:drug/metabolite transporter (DMT)-like permease